MLKACSLVLVSLLLAACGIVVDGGNLKLRDDETDIISIGRDGFRLDGNLTGLTLDSAGLHIEYPNGGLSWDDEGFGITHEAGAIRVADGRMTVTGSDGKQQVLDTTGGGAEYRSESGALVRTGGKAEIPADYPGDALPLPEGFTLNASALLGSVQVVSGYVSGTTVEDMTAYYKDLMSPSDSYSQEIKDGRAVLRARIGGRDMTVYLFRSVTADAVNVSVVVGQ